MMAFWMRFIVRLMPLAPRHWPVAGSSCGSAARRAHWNCSAASPVRVIWRIAKQGASLRGRRLPSRPLGGSFRRTSGEGSICSRSARSRSCCCRSCWAGSGSAARATPVQALTAREARMAWRSALRRGKSIPVRGVRGAGPAATGSSLRQERRAISRPCEISCNNSSNYDERSGMRP